MNASNKPVALLPVNLPKYDRCGVLIEYYDDGNGNFAEVRTDILPMSQDHYTSEASVDRFYRDLDHSLDYSLPALD